MFMVNCLEANLLPSRKTTFLAKLKPLLIGEGCTYSKEWMHFQPSQSFPRLTKSLWCVLSIKSFYTSWTCFEHSFDEGPSNRNSSCSAFEVCGSIFLGIKTLRRERKRCCFYYALAKHCFPKAYVTSTIKRNP